MKGVVRRIWDEELPGYDTYYSRNSIIPLDVR
jgi:hypothetical protein